MKRRAGFPRPLGFFDIYFRLVSRPTEDSCRRNHSVDPHCPQRRFCFFVAEGRQDLETSAFHFFTVVAQFIGLSSLSPCGRG